MMLRYLHAYNMYLSTVVQRICWENRDIILLEYAAVYGNSGGVRTCNFRRTISPNKEQLGGNI